MRLLLAPALTLEGLSNEDHEAVDGNLNPGGQRCDGLPSVVAPVLVEDYEHRAMTGDSDRLKRTILGLKRNGVVGDRLVQIIAEAIPHIDRDGAEWLLVDLGVDHG